MQPNTKHQTLTSRRYGEYNILISHAFDGKPLSFDDSCNAPWSRLKAFTLNSMPTPSLPVSECSRSVRGFFMDDDIFHLNIRTTFGCHQG